MMKNKKTAKKIAIKNRKPISQPPDADLRELLTCLEFHRQAVALMPLPTDRQAGVAVVLLASDNRQLGHRGCSCKGSRRQTCKHQKRLDLAMQAYRAKYAAQHPYERFQASLWRKLAELLAQTYRLPLKHMGLSGLERPTGTELFICDNQKQIRLVYRSTQSDQNRLMERLAGNRHQAIGQLRRLTRTDQEMHINASGMKTRRQTLEDSFWHRLAYHAFCELGTGGFALKYSVDESSGQFWLEIAPTAQACSFKIAIPQQAVHSLLTDAAFPISKHNPGLRVFKTPIMPSLDIARQADGGLKLTPTYLFQPPDGDPIRLTSAEFARHRFGDLLHVPDTRMMVPVSAPDALFKAYAHGDSHLIESERAPEFLQTHAKAIAEGPHRLDGGIRGMQIFTIAEQAAIRPESIQRDWCWLSVKYGFGNSEISLRQLMELGRQGQRYVPVDGGWVDLQSDEMAVLSQIPGDQREFDDSGNSIKIRRMQIFRLSQAARQTVDMGGTRKQVAMLKRLLDIKPASPPPTIHGMRSHLRDYQRRGMQWLWYLYENHFGGLLCDDMGLGKTHQIMALMLCLQGRQRGPMLVVCPTTVISHWAKKIADHAPDIKTAVYHGPDRDIDQALKTAQVLISSYGIVMRDRHKLKPLAFKLAVFDEIQHIKNPTTKSWRACAAIAADMKIGLTGTPIENSINELKALMDIVAPGYLGPDLAFERRYTHAVEQADDNLRKQELSRLIRPFTLRRMKTSVLHELPEKIEDIRFCQLSDDQVRLYREAIDARRSHFMDSLSDPSAAVPYIHIFALLTLLKQICNHPASVEKKPENYQQWPSGKWDLFTELLDETLNSGQKVVIYSQFVQMIRIIQLHLNHLNIGHVVLTGQSARRGKLIAQFNDDPACRVFVGSLKAGGVGIDLVAASVVIHYDRWWNAAKEDQATDRVHRIGQQRGVQVFKLVTEGTLEEKISAIIERKRNLMDAVVKEDDPGLLKTFSRQELTELIALPI